MKTEMIRKKRSSRNTTRSQAREAAVYRRDRDAAPADSGDGWIGFGCESVLKLACLVQFRNKKKRQVLAERRATGFAGLAFDIENQIHSRVN